MRSIRRLVSVALRSVLVPTMPPAGAAIPPGRYAIGDSVMVGAKEELTAHGIKVNAVTSRQFRDAVGIVERLKANGKLRRKVIVHLGNNAIRDRGVRLRLDSSVAGANRTVYVVNLKIPRSYREESRTNAWPCARRRANTVLVNWFAYSRDHPSWFAADGFHLTALGQSRYAAFIAAKTV